MPGLTWIEYRTDDGLAVELRVSPELAEALDAADPRLKEVTFTDLAGKLRHGDHRRGLDPDRLELGMERRHAAQRHTPVASSWEGPRFHFSLLLGEGRPGWLGGETVDDRGRCGLCHGQWLPPYACCLACCRTGRDDAIPTPGEQVRRRAPRPSRSRSGRRLAGGVGR
jgi:hypothetical protein